MSAAHMGCTHSPETRAQISATKMGHSVSLEARAKMSAAKKGRNLGKECSVQTRAKIGNANRGKKPGLETRAKMSKAKTVPLGSTHIRDGYVRVKTENGWEAEHRVVLGLAIGDPRIGHHVDGDKTNNDPANLRVFESTSAHLRHHARARHAET